MPVADLSKLVKLPVDDVATAVGFTLAVLGAVIVLRMLPPTKKLVS
jgi:hypothetical protein